MPQSGGVLRKRVAGALLMALGAFALATPVAAGRWSLAILGIPLIALSVAEAYAAFTSPQRANASAYLPCLLALLAGNLLLLSSALVVSGLLILLVAILLIDGFGKILAVWRKPEAPRVPTIVNGLVDFGWRRAGDRHRRRRLYRSSWVADADGAGRSYNARRGRGGPEGSPRPRARPCSQRDLRSPARRSRRRVADGAGHRSHVDDDPCCCVPGDSRRQDADIGQPARHQFSLRCDGRGRSDDRGLGDASHPSGAPPVETIDKAGRACGVVAAARRKGRHCTNESRG